jgi:benzoylformate decarboxylase
VGQNDLVALCDSALEPTAIPHSHRWLPRRVEGLPHEHRLWVDNPGLVARSGTISLEEVTATAAHPEGHMDGLLIRHRSRFPTSQPGSGAPMADAKGQATRWVRDYVFDILKDLGIRYIFGVPGTNEAPIIDGCYVEGNDVKYVLCLHENIAMGAAMGYARMTGKPGVVVLHATPGAGHSLGNLSNAWKSRVPLVILCGQQQHELVTQQPLLASNVVQVVSQFTKWAHELRSWKEASVVLQRAFKEAMAAPAGPVFVSIPWDFTIHQIGPDERVRGVTRVQARSTGDAAAVQQAARVLAEAKSPVIVVGDGVGYAGAWEEAQQLAESLGAPVYLEGQSSMANFPNSDYHWQGELPGDQTATQDRFKLHDVAFLCGFGAQAQLIVFKYADGPLIPDSVRQVYLHNNPWELGKNHFGEVAILGDIKATLTGLIAEVRKNSPAQVAERNKKLEAYAEHRRAAWADYITTAQQRQPIDAAVVASALGELIAEYKLGKKFVYVHEAVSDATPFQFFLPLGGPDAEPTSYYSVEGGSLGWSMPATLGIKLARESHQGVAADVVINAVGDGSALFYPQVWWTATQQSLPVLYVIMNNKEYRTLLQGLEAVIKYYQGEPYDWKPVSTSPAYLHLENPDVDFVALAKAFGVADGRRVGRPDEVKAVLKEGLEYVLGKKKAFVVELFTEQNPATAAPVILPQEHRLQMVRSREEPPPLNIFYYKEKGLL